MKYSWKHLKARKYNHVSTNDPHPPQKCMTSFQDVVSLLSLGWGVGQTNVYLSVHAEEPKV